MRPVQTIATVVFTVAIVIAGCTTHATRPAVHPSPTPDTVVATPVPKHPTPAPKPPGPSPRGPIDRAPAPRPVLADGRYDAYIRTVDLGRNQLVVDLVQVFHDQAATEAFIADGKPRDAAQTVKGYIRNQNPRLRTLPMAGDLRVDVIRGHDTQDGCDGPILLHKLDVLISDVSFHTPTLYFTLTVIGGVVHHIKEASIQPAC
jgi:hypothetical protein